MRQRSVFSIAVLAAALSGGCAKKTIDDAALVTNIKSQMFSDPQMKDASLQVTSNQAAVTLSGTLSRVEQRKVVALIKSLKAQGRGVIFISHTLPHVLQVTDRVVVLRLGKVVRDAPTTEFDAESLLGTITGLIESA